MLAGLTGTSPCPCCAYAQVAAVSPFSIARLLGGRARAAPVQASTVAIDARDLLFHGATIVDPRDGGKATDMAVRVRAQRIVDVYRVGSKPDAPGARRIDTTGRFIVPGYNDMHSHVLELADPSGALALMLAEGVTGFRQMSGSPALLAKRRSGKLPIGPAAPALHETPGSILTPFNAGSAKDVIEEVRRQQAQGADFIKVGFVDPHVFFVAVEEAQRCGIGILGHLQEGTDALDATRAGFRSIEHLGPGSTVWISCSADEAVLRDDSHRRELIKAPPFKVPFLETLVMKRLGKMLINPSAFAKPADVARLDRAITTFDAGKGRAVADAFAADGSWQVPTLVRLRTQEYADSTEYDDDNGLAYMPEANVRRWREVTDRYKALPPEMLATFRDAYPRQQALAKLFADAGVRMMVGTDGGSFLGPGLTLKQEFKELSDAGIAPLDVLRMATINAADYLGRSKTMGLVAIGHDADLVLLTADPLDQIENLHRIAGVVRAGTYYTSGDLDALKAQVAAHRGSLH